MKQLDRRIIYLLVLLALGAPLVAGLVVRPVRMESAEKFYRLVGELQPAPGEMALVVFDFGPNSKAENAPQAEAVVEHLMRRRVPLLFFSTYPLAEPFLKSIPEQVAERLMREYPEQRWQYGRDWVNLGYRPGAFTIIQAMATTENMVELLANDARGNSLKDLPATRELRRLEQIKLLAHFTSLTSTFETFVQFFQKKNYRPIFTHGCTSITIPKAYIYLDSGQLSGLLEGVAGAAWYSVLLNEHFPRRIDGDALRINTGLGAAQLMIVALIVLGNLGMLISRRRS